MWVVGTLRRVAIGPDRRPPPARPRRWATILLYGMPLGLLALVGLGMANAAYLLENREMNQAVAGLLSAWSVLPVAVAVRRPLLAWRIAYPMLFLGVIGATGREPWPWSPVQILGFLFVLVVLALREESGAVAWVTALSVAPVFVFAPRANAWGAATLLVVIGLAGDLVSRWRRNRQALAEQAELTELEKARRALLEERARIAREMHDVVAHHMSMIAVQAETAPYRIPGLPPPTLAEFTAIAAGAREALTDMRRLLGVLRAETDESLRAPQPGLSEVATLVETAARAGVAVTLASSDIEGVPEAVGLAAYRIVQEALANAARHAPGGRVWVSVRGSAGALLVEVGNGPGSAAVTSAGAGHGLIGMRERATLLGGTLEAGPQPDGGYLVTARLPLSEGE
jgi:signal transduction histidine kinase